MEYYVVCPANVVTGGPDALHQMVYYMQKVGLNCKLAYIADNKKNTLIPEPYKVYIKDFCLFKEIEDKENIGIIIPETFAYFSNYFNNAKVYIWWLSVDNSVIKDIGIIKKIFYVLSYPARVIKHKKLYKGAIYAKLKSFLDAKTYSFFNEKDNIVHLCASYYALDYVSKNTTKEVFKCIEPISLYFLEAFQKERIDAYMRDNVILYNPKKSGEFVSVLEKKYKNLQFKPLVNMSQSDLVKAYLQAKLYIDFGPFPGAERIPKEAVLFGCIVITGKHGASAYYNDVVISDNYKFDEKLQLKEIVDEISNCLNNYEQEVKQFKEYKSTVINLEKRFMESIREIF